MPRAMLKKLLVEGDEEKRVIPYFMDEHFVWGDTKEEWVVMIEEFDGVENLLKPGVIEAESKVPGLLALGVIIDADDQLESQWLRVRDRFRRVDRDFPENLPPEGLIHKSSGGVRMGVWIMPDNRSRGMLETFLGMLMEPDRQAMWSFAQSSCLQAKDHGALYKEVHRDKACIHTYLAWLDPPGHSLHVSILAKALDSRLPLGILFVQWFMDLFQLTPRDTPLPEKIKLA